MSKIANIVITWNRKIYAERFMKNYLVATKVPHILVIADNNSTDGTKEFLKDLEEKYKKGETPEHIKLIFRYYRKNFGPLRVENHFLRHPPDPMAIYYGRLFSDVNLSLTRCDDWLKEFEEILDNCPEVVAVAPLDRDWDREEDFITTNGKTYINGTLFEFSEEFRLTRKKVYETFGRPLYNIWTITPTMFFDRVRAKGFITAVAPNVRLFDFHNLNQPNKLEHLDTYKKHVLLSKRIYTDAKIWQADTAGMLEWEEDGKMYKDESEPVNEIFAPEEMLIEKHTVAELDNGVSLDDMKLFKDGDRRIKW